MSNKFTDKILGIFNLHHYICKDRIILGSCDKAFTPPRDPFDPTPQIQSDTENRTPWNKQIKPYGLRRHSLRIRTWPYHDPQVRNRMVSCFSCEHMFYHAQNGKQLISPAQQRITHVFETMGLPAPVYSRYVMRPNWET